MRPVKQKGKQPEKNNGKEKGKGKKSVTRQPQEAPLSNLGASTSTNNFALHQAISSGAELGQINKVLHHNLRFINVRDSNNLTPLLIAVQSKTLPQKKEVIKHLLDHGADPRLPFVDKKGRKAYTVVEKLMVSPTQDNCELLFCFLVKGAPINNIRSHIHSPLVLALKKNASPSVITMMMALGAEASQKELSFNQHDDLSMNELNVTSTIVNVFKKFMELYHYILDRCAEKLPAFPKLHLQEILEKDRDLQNRLKDFKLLLSELIQACEKQTIDNHIGNHKFNKGCRYNKRRLALADTFNDVLCYDEQHTAQVIGFYGFLVFLYFRKEILNRTRQIEIERIQLVVKANQPIITLEKYILLHITPRPKKLQLIFKMHLPELHSIMPWFEGWKKLRPLIPLPLVNHTTSISSTINPAYAAKLKNRLYRFSPHSNRIDSFFRILDTPLNKPRNIDTTIPLAAIDPFDEKKFQIIHRFNEKTYIQQFKTIFNFLHGRGVESSKKPENFEQADLDRLLVLAAMLFEETVILACLLRLGADPNAKVPFFGPTE